MTWTRFDGELAARPRLVRDVVVVGAVLTLTLTLFFGLVVLPGVAVVAVAESELVLFGALLVTTSLIRMAAGLFAARMYRRRHGTDTRTEALPSVLAAVAVGWSGYALLVLGSAALTGAAPDLGRLLLELPRWLLEGAAGAALVAPGEPEQLDPRLRRFTMPERRRR